MRTSIWNDVIDTLLHKQDFTKGAPLYFDLNNPSNQGTYNNIQKSIESQVKNVCALLNNMGSNDQKSMNDLIEILKDKRDESLKKEATLLLPNNTNNTYTNKNYSYTNRIKLATEVYLGLTKSKNGIKIDGNDKAKMYLGYFFKSNELYESLKSNGAGELLSRTAISGPQTDAKINQKTINKLKRIFTQLINNSNLDSAISKDVITSIQQIFKEDSTHFWKLQQSKNKDIFPLATSYSSSRRDNIRNILDAYNNNEKNTTKLEGIVVRKDTNNNTIDVDIVPLGGEINNSNAALIVFSSAATHGKNNWYLAFKNNKDAYKIILIFSQLVLKALNNCNNNEFNVNNVGTIKINDDMKKAMKKELIPAHIQQFVDIAGDNLNKFFNPANSNAFLSGFLGELGNYYIIKGKQNNLDIKITGDAYEAINGNLKSQSTADATVGKGKNAYGFNIKNYISKGNGGTITLYESTNGLDIFNDFIYKYFAKEEVILARRLVLGANQGDIEMADIKSSVGTIALKNLPNFLRITNADGTITNLFFILNNICYPASYIYHLLISDLKKTTKKDSNIDKFFTFTYNEVETPTFNDDQEAQANMKKDNGNIAADALQDKNFVDKYRPKISLYIQFKGLKINNLMSYI